MSYSFPNSALKFLLPAAFLNIRHFNNIPTALSGGGYITVSAYSSVNDLSFVLKLYPKP